jgi:ferrochelatase
MKPTMFANNTLNIKVLNENSDSIDFKNDRWGIILFNMGSPESLKQVREYLKAIFRDKAIIKFPLSPLLQWPLSEIISRSRAKGSAEKYSLIGGSPLLDIQNKLADKVQTHLRETYSHVKLYSSMRYTPPLIPEQLKRCEDDSCKYVLIIPMYPQYCYATTGSSVIEIEKYIRRSKPDFDIQMIKDFHDYPGYNDILRKSLNTKLSSFNDDIKTMVLFSAHSIPQKLADTGDPYVSQIEKSSELIAGDHDYMVTYQSRTGPVKWVGPGTFETVEKLRSSGYGRIITVPISFVADNLETLYDIDIILKKHCDNLGMQIERIECPNDSDEFADATSRMLITAIEFRGTN